VAKQSIAFRFKASTVEHLRRRSAEARAAQTELAERYIEEGLRQDEHPLISFRDGAAGRRPVVLGSRLGVADIVQTIRQNDNSVDAAAEYLEIPVEHVDAALRYYADFKDEVDEWISRTQAVAERERLRASHQRAALS
jgi:uncharacterized protein (DUF433 family)